MGARNGRPPKYGPETVAEALRRLASGESIHRVARDIRAHPHTVMGWRDKARDEADREQAGRVPDSLRGMFE